VHTGHGDARGEASWGTPDRIDDLYLRNPMPLVDALAAPMIDSVAAQSTGTRLQPPALIVHSILDLRPRPPFQGRVYELIVGAFSVIGDDEPEC
jgi:hypothetical protein